MQELAQDPVKETQDPVKETQDPMEELAQDPVKETQDPVEDPVQETKAQEPVDPVNNEQIEHDDSTNTNEPTGINKLGSDDP